MQFYTILQERLKQLQTEDRVISTCYLKFRAHVACFTLLVCSFVSLQKLSSTYFPNAGLLIFFRKIIPEERIPLVLLNIECSEGKIVKELGIFKDRIVLGCSFLPPKDYKPTFQAKWYTKNMHGINWNHKKLEYSELAFIIPQHCSPTTEYFAKGIEKCKNLVPYLCKVVENRNDLGCPKASKLFENDDAE